MFLSKAVEVCPPANGGAAAASPPGALRLSSWITAGRPHFFVALSVLALGIGAWFLSFFLRFEFEIPSSWMVPAVQSLPLVLLVQGLCFYGHGVFRILWPYVSVRDAFVILRSAIYATSILLAINVFAPGSGLAPMSVILIHGIVTHMAVCGLFLVLRFTREARLRSIGAAPQGKKVLVVGAGDSGDALLREIERAPGRMTVAGFIDDDPNKRGAHLRGVPVIGGTPDVARLAKALGIRQVLVALPGTDPARLRDIVGPLFAADLEIKALPTLSKLSTRSALLPQLKDVAIEDLLRRDPIRLDEAGIGKFLGGKVVLVTGAAGSIGSELCRQILRYAPAKLVTLDWAETPLHDLMLELRVGENASRIIPELGDVTDFVRIRTVFADHSPDIVFHAAALKHVPVCEDHPREAIRVNVGGTRTVARAATCAGTSTFVMISTDKAVNPSSVMGSTKRAAELVIQGLQSEGGPTRFAAVRFGNVLGSNGSVLRIFKNQLIKGGPLTVTHPDMRRYFMTIPEAVTLVLQAAILGGGGEVFELDMGEPVKIVDLAQDFIRLSGLTAGRDIDIEFTGMRPGEKLFEELYLHSETVEPTAHPKVFCLKKPERPELDPAVRLCLDRLGPVDPALDPDLARLNRAFKRMVDETGERDETSEKVSSS